MGKQIQWAVYPVQSGAIGNVQVNIYPTVGEAQVRTFNLLDATAKKEIREWFERFL
jgi:hypothetical protein